MLTKQKPPVEELTLPEMITMLLAKREGSYGIIIGITPVFLKSTVWTQNGSPAVYR
jgi:hypothetical protein